MRRAHARTYVGEQPGYVRTRAPAHVRPYVRTQAVLEQDRRSARVTLSLIQSRPAPSLSPSSLAQARHRVRRHHRHRVPLLAPSSPPLIFIVIILAVSVRCAQTYVPAGPMPIWFRPRRRSAAPRMADAANDPVPPIAATSVAGGSDLGLDEVLEVLSQGTLHSESPLHRAYVRIADLENVLQRLGAAYKSTQHELEVACLRTEIKEATIRRLQSRLEAQKEKLTSDAALLTDIRILLANATTSVLCSLDGGGPAALPGCSQTGHAGPPSPARSADAQCDKNFHLKVHYSKKAVIMDDKRGVVFEATESPADAKKRKRREEYARTKAKRLTRDRATQYDLQRPLERHGSGAMASASGSSAALSGSGHGVPSSAAEAVPHLSDNSEDGSGLG